MITEIKVRELTEIELTKSEKNYKSVVENINEVIFQTDNDGLWLFLNKSWEEITGFSVDESLGQSFLNYVHPDDRQRNLELFAPVINREKDYCRHEIRYLTKEGGFSWIEVYARLGINENNEAIGTYGTLQDITERKRAEDFEFEMLQLSSQLTGVTIKEIDLALNLALSRIGNFLNADRAYIFEFENANTEMNNTYEWCNEGISPEIDNLQHIPSDILPMWMEELNNHRNIVITSLKDLPLEWQVERDILEPQVIKSLIVIPMLFKDNLIGFVGLDSVSSEKQYSSAEINILKVWSSMLSSLINNQRTESLLEQTRQNFEIFFNTIDDFLWVLDDQGRIIHINNTVMNRLGYLKNELENKSVLMVHPAERMEEAIRNLGEMLQGTIEYCPIPIVTKQGQLIPVETKMIQGLWNGKKVVFGVSKDISKIQLSEHKFATAFQSSAALMTITKYENGEYIDINNAFIETVGYEREEIIGKTVKELGLFEDENLRDNIIDQLDRKIPIQKVETVIHSKSGAYRTILLSADTIYIGEMRCLLIVSVDITVRKLAEEKTRKAQLEAEQANSAKSEFLSRMSHELRTPLNSILGFAQLLEMGELTTGQKKGVNHIMNSGKHLLNLINEVLDISRIEAGHLSISIEPIKLNSIIEEMLDVIRPLATEKQIKLELVISDNEQLFVNFDRQSLKQVLLNLLNNAVKYNKPVGSVLIKTQLLPINEDAKEFIRISISDTGIGISADDIPKIFTPFERIGVEKYGIEGTGLGLAVVKKLIDAMDGFIGMESAMGEGSTFWIDIPKAESRLESLRKLDNLADNNEESNLIKGTILYIEDNTSNIELVEQILSLQRPEIKLISNINGNNAVSLAVKYQPDLVLLDLNLTDIHGSEVLKLIFANKITRNIPVVVISADAMSKQVESMLNAGAKNYLIKPIDVSEFLKVIDEYIQV